MPGDDPSEVPWRGCTQNRGPTSWDVSEHLADVGHRGDEPPAILGRQGSEELLDGLDLAGVENGERGGSGRGEAHDMPARVDAGLFARGEAVGGEAVEDPAQVAGVEVQLATQVGDPSTVSRWASS